MKFNQAQARVMVDEACADVRATPMDPPYQDCFCSVVPDLCETKAAEAEADHEWWLAACWWDRGNAVSLGHNRGARYQAAAAKARANAAKEG